jgi:hypothetical protein
VSATQAFRAELDTTLLTRAIGWGFGNKPWSCGGSRKTGSGGSRLAAKAS